MSRTNKERELWLVNISRKKDVSIGDLRLTIRRGQSVNILDSKHYNYTEDQIKKSLKDGSLYKRRNIIKIREVPPVRFKNLIKIEKPIVLKPLRSGLKIEEKKYEDLDFLDDIESEDVLDEATEADFMDQKPRLAVDKKYTNPDIDVEDEES